MQPPERLYYTGDEEADRLLATDPLALLVGFTLDQQVPLQKAFSGPLELRRRIGPYDAARLAAMDPGELEAAFRARPALHRFPAAMARRVQEVAAAIVRDYEGRPEQIWAGAQDGRDLERRLRSLPGFGEMKASTILAVLARRFDVQLPGIESVLPDHPTLGDVDSYEARDRYQAGKRAHKAALRAAAASG
ncbi:MAG TPA: HhH-GPD-type base excision DNA repair protein, partial [Candidatus Limnocylindrales bacterium]|nr:HhH-GPD-type base excision DNA repair protein [Candidatus Limnocylindrales bacterium]